jgi:C1A family cysteine protease
MSIRHKYGWRRDAPDSRDHLFRLRFRLADPITLPPSADLRKGCSPVEDQQSLGSCTAQALVGALEYLELADPLSVKAFQDLSRLFVYYNELNAEGSLPNDNGAQIRTGTKTLASIGVCRESLWQYDISKFADPPPQPCYDEGLLHKITAYQRMLTLDEIRACLAGGLPAVFGWTVYPSAETDAVDQTGDVPFPSFWERKFKQPLGGHASVAVGYDNATRKVRFRNSWRKRDGTLWGNAGYGTLDYDYFNDPELSSDYWVIQKTESDLFAFKQNIEEVAV